MIRLPPARSRVDLKLAHDGCNAASPAAGVDGGTILTAVTQPVRPPSLLVAESVRFERRVNAHQGPKSRVTCDSSGEAASLSATTTRSIIRCAGLLARRGRGAIEVRSDGVARGRRRRRARRHRRRPLRQSGQPGHAGSAPRAAGIALVAECGAGEAACNIAALHRQLSGCSFSRPVADGRPPVAARGCLTPEAAVLVATSS